MAWVTQCPKCGQSRVFNHKAGVCYVCAPAQEEKEMDRDGVHTGGIKPDNPMQLPPSVGNRLVPGFLPRPEAAAEKRAAEMDHYPNATFRGHTCGKCAWSMKTTDSCKFICRRSDWRSVNVAEPACPAFVSREVKP